MVFLGLFQELFFCKNLAVPLHSYNALDRLRLLLSCVILILLPQNANIQRQNTEGVTEAAAGHKTHFINSYTK
jgi:hypothetical protein